MDWISVEDRLPEDSDWLEVIVNAGDCVTCCWYNPDDDEWLLDPERVFDGEVTHWMPLPEPPK